MDTSSSPRPSMTRWSMPSKRPQTISGPDPAASSATRDWVNGRPRGLISNFGRSEATSAASMAAANTSARNTMPGPPPAGVSSTLRWRSVAEARISRASSAHSPAESALPARLTPSGPGNISGNRVRTVVCQGERLVITSQFCRPGQAKRDPGPITTASDFAMNGCNLSQNHGLWLWVPAFAGTTRGVGGVRLVAVNLFGQRDHDTAAGKIDGRNDRIGERQQHRHPARWRDLDDVAGAAIMYRTATT